MGVVTGEAVELDLRPASIGTRTVASAIDLAVIAAVFVPVATAAAALLDRAGADEALSAAVFVALLVLVVLAGPVTVETLSRGKSVGRWTMGTRVVRDDGGAIRFRHALIRQLLWIVEVQLTFGGLALIVAMLNERSKRLGDLLAGTYVQVERVRTRETRALAMPAPLAGWAQVADIARPAASLDRAVYRFLMRAPRMDPGVRAGMAAELAGRLAPSASPAPPAGTPAEDFLMAVATVLRDRDVARWQGRQVHARADGARIRALPHGMDRFDPDAAPAER